MFKVRVQTKFSLFLPIIQHLKNLPYYSKFYSRIISSGLLRRTHYFQNISRTHKASATESMQGTVQLSVSNYHLFRFPAESFHSATYSADLAIVFTHGVNQFAHLMSYASALDVIRQTTALQKKYCCMLIRGGYMYSLLHTISVHIYSLVLPCLLMSYAAHLMSYAKLQHCKKNIAVC